MLTENVMREDLTPIEEIDANANFVDMLMCEDEEYARNRKIPLQIFGTTRRMDCKRAKSDVSL